MDRCSRVLYEFKKKSLTVNVWDAGMVYENIILPKEIDAFPVNLAGFTIGSGSSTQQLYEYSVIFKWLTLLPLSLAIVSYWKLIKVFR